MANEKSIDDDVKIFIRNVIESFEHMEILLLLHANPEKEWSARDVCNKLRNDYDSAINRLADLEAKGLLESRTSGTLYYRFKPKKDSLTKTVDKLARTYLERRVTVINLIFSKPHEKIQVFAEAFKIRKD